MCLSCDFRSTLQFMFFRTLSQRLWLIRLSWIWVRWFFQNFAMTAAWSDVMPPCFLVWAVRKASSWFKSMSAEAIDCRKIKGIKGKSLLNWGLKGHVFSVWQILDLEGAVQTNQVMQITWDLSLRHSLQVPTTYPRLLPHSSWRGVGWLQQWAGSTFGSSALVWDSKEASPCLLAPSPLCHSIPKCTMLRTLCQLWHCSAGPGNRKAGTKKACSWAGTSEVAA